MHMPSGVKEHQKSLFVVRRFQPEREITMDDIATKYRNAIPTVKRGALVGANKNDRRIGTIEATFNQKDITIKMNGPACRSLESEINKMVEDWFVCANKINKQMIKQHKLGVKLEDALIRFGLMQHEEEAYASELVVKKQKRLSKEETKNVEMARIAKERRKAEKELKRQEAAAKAKALFSSSSSEVLTYFLSA